MKTRILGEEPYSDLICFHVKKEFPKVTQLTNCEVVEVLSNIIIGTKEVRYGTLPTPESLVVIRYAIRQAMDKGTPIPILVPWGSIKANFESSLDIAELSALQRLVQLSSDVKEYYPLGVEIVIRVEDTSAYTLFSLEGHLDTLREKVDSYSLDMKNLVSILSPDKQIRVQLESEMELSDKFNNEKFWDNYRMIYKYLDVTKINYDPEIMMATPEYQRLSQLGWRGYISREQREHYLSNYRKIYDWDENTNMQRLSLYFAGAWRRFQLEMTGKQDYWDKFIQLVFVPPIKGLPEGYSHNYVYYRTLPLSQARTHMPPWRAKGYLKINGNTVCHKLVSFNDAETINKLTPINMVITDDSGNLSVTIKADYLLES